MDVRVERRLFTVEEYHRMAEAGILSEDDQVELIEGEIVEMSPIGSRHAAAVKRLLNLFLPAQAAGRAILSVRDPIRLGRRSEPQPDVALLRPREDFYASEHPGPEDVLLIVEVAEHSAGYDRGVKVPLYARYGVVEVWVVDLLRGVVEVYRGPEGEGYREVRVVGRGEVITPLQLPDLHVPVDQILGETSLGKGERWGWSC
jgi:Uma2 family endonuclease